MLALYAVVTIAATALVERRLLGEILTYLRRGRPGRSGMISRACDRGRA